MKLNIECPECKTKYKLDIKEVRSAEENRLIAAAPELLEACILALNDFEMEGIELNHDTVTSLRQAMNKAQRR